MCLEPMKNLEISLSKKERERLRVGASVWNVSETDLAAAIVAWAMKEATQYLWAHGGPRTDDGQCLAYYSRKARKRAKRTARK